MDVRFEEITDENIGHVHEVYNYYVDHSTVTFHLEPITLDEMKAMLPTNKNMYPSYVVMADREPSGYCYLSNFRKKEAYDITAEITLYLAPSATKKGLGSIVLDYLEERAKENGIKNLIAVITGENESSVKLFSRHGYRHAALLKNVGLKFGRFLNVFWYQKEI